MIPRESQNQARTLHAILPIAALFLLCLLWAATALRPDLLPTLTPESLPYFASHTFPLFLLACAAHCRRRGSNRPTLSQIRAAVPLGLTLFTFPAILIHLASNGISGTARTTLFCLVPVFTVVLRPHLGQNPQQPNGSILLAALVAILGALCIFPVNYPQSPQATLAFASILLAVASISAANCLAEATAGHAKSQPPAAFSTTAAIAAITAAISFVLLSALFEQVPWTAVLQQVRTSGVIPYLPSLLWAALIELPALVLFFWLVPRLSAIRLSTRYLLAPLLSILVGTALLRAQQQIQPRTWIGLALMAVSVAWLLSAPEASASLPSLSPPRSEA